MKLVLVAAILSLLGVTKVELPFGLAPGDDPRADWSSVLDNFVDDRGRVDFKGLAEDIEPLLRYLRHVSEVNRSSHPELFPTKQHAIAHYINAYNAISMFNVLDLGLPESIGGFNKVKFFVLRSFLIGGEWQSLYAYENDVIRPLGEERIHVALNCMARSCPRLPQKPFTAETLDEELDRESRRFFNETRHVAVDHERKVVRISEILDFFPEDFLTKAPSLIAYINKYRETPVPEDYKVEFIDYDWTINRQPEVGG